MPNETHNQQPNQPEEEKQQDQLQQPVTPEVQPEAKPAQQTEGDPAASQPVKQPWATRVGGRTDTVMTGLWSENNLAQEIAELEKKINGAPKQESSAETFVTIDQLSLSNKQLSRQILLTSDIRQLTRGATYLAIAGYFAAAETINNLVEALSNLYGYVGSKLGAAATAIDKNVITPLVDAVVVAWRAAVRAVAVVWQGVKDGANATAKFACGVAASTLKWGSIIGATIAKLPEAVGQKFEEVKEEYNKTHPETPDDKKSLEGAAQHANGSQPPEALTSNYGQTPKLEVT